MVTRCVRVAIITIEGASPDSARDVRRGNQVWTEECDARIDIVATRTIDRPDLLILDQDDCLLEGHEVSDAEDALFDLGRDLGADIVCYYVQSDVAGFRGCAAHPPGRRGFWVADSATPWTFVHELTHVVGGNRHVDDSDNLMFEDGTASITNLPPDLSTRQCGRISNDASADSCDQWLEATLHMTIQTR